MFRNASIQDLADGYSAGADVVQEVIANMNSAAPSGRGSCEAQDDSGHNFQSRLLLVWECVKKTGCSRACGAGCRASWGRFRGASVKTTPRMTRFRDAKVCNNLATDEIDDHRIHCLTTSTKVNYKILKERNLYLVLRLRGETEHDTNVNQRDHQGYCVCVVKPSTTPMTT